MPKLLNTKDMSSNATAKALGYTLGRTKWKRQRRWLKDGKCHFTGDVFESWAWLRDTNQIA
jgi:hypothetical protein